MDISCNCYPTANVKMLMRPLMITMSCAPVLKLDAIFNQGFAKTSFSELSYFIVGLREACTSLQLLIIFAQSWEM